jgi:hypothetical protein
MPLTGERASSPIGSASSSGAISVSATLARDRVRRVGAFDQVEHLGRDGDRHRLSGGGEPRVGRDQSFALQRLEGPHGLHGGRHIAGNTAFNQFGKPASSGQ